MNLALYWLDSSVILQCLVLLVHVSENQDLWISIASSAHLGATGCVNVQSEEDNIKSY